MPIDKSESVSMGADQLPKVCHLPKYGGLLTFQASHASVQNAGGCLRLSVAICNFCKMSGAASITLRLHSSCTNCNRHNRLESNGSPD
jgi:hypothetical protein